MAVCSSRQAKSGQFRTLGVTRVNPSFDAITNLSLQCENPLIAEGTLGCQGCVPAIPVTANTITLPIRAVPSFRAELCSSLGSRFLVRDQIMSHPSADA
jgi:hypothetical protein